MQSHNFRVRSAIEGFDSGIRAVSSSHGSSLCLTNNSKATDGLRLDNLNERFVSHVVQLDAEVKTVSPQPLTIDLTTGAIVKTPEEKLELRQQLKRRGNQPNFYTPDFGLNWSCGDNALIEVKDERYPGDEDYQRKLRLASRLLYEAGYEFLHIIVPSDLRHPLQINVPLLRMTHFRPEVELPVDTMERVAHLENTGARSIGDFVKGLELDSRLSPYLVARGYLAVDITAHVLNFAMPAVAAWGDLSHLSLTRKLAS